MKKFEIYELRDVLNYDSHRENVFTFYERLCIHKAISHHLSFEEKKELNVSLAMKVKQVLEHMNRHNIDTVDVIYKIDPITYKITTYENGK